MSPERSSGKIKVPPLIRVLIEKIRERALDNLKECEELAPVLFFFKEDPTTKEGFGPQVAILPIHELMNSQEGKMVVQHIMEDSVEQEDIDIVIMVSEAWMAAFPADSTTREKVHQLKASEQSNREEAILFSILTKTRQYLGFSKIVREPELELLPLEIFATDEDPDTEGVLVRSRKPKIH